MYVTSTTLVVLIPDPPFLKLDGVSTCWEHVTKVLNAAPDEGVCLSVLSTAARHGVPDLATDVLRVLKMTDIAWEEHHFAALIEALCRKGQLQDAFITLHVMRTNGIDPVETTASSIVNSIRSDIDTVDSAWAIIDEIHSNGSGLDIDALNAVVEASIKLGDLQRAIGIYKAFPDYGLSPDTTTYDHLLDGCITAQHRQLGDILLEDMKKASLKPDSKTYEKMIDLCLTQEYYEDAFYYLEEMKGAQFLPPRSVYEAIYEKCHMAGDSRKSMVVEEMKECGYDDFTSATTRESRSAKARH
jgi:pentatricopeptide repeat protein